MVYRKTEGLNFLFCLGKYHDIIAKFHINNDVFNECDIQVTCIFLFFRNSNSKGIIKKENKLTEIDWSIWCSNTLLKILSSFIDKKSEWKIEEQFNEIKVWMYSKTDINLWNWIKIMYGRDDHLECMNVYLSIRC